jgi:predicted amidohydrolase YtcJ
LNDLLITGRIHTMDPARPLAEAALARDGRFVRVGSAAACAAEAFPGATRIDLGRGSATPGLGDAHGHVLWYGWSLVEPSCADLGSEAECAAAIAAAARGLAPGAWLRAWGWNPNLWPASEPATEAALTAAAPRNPVVVLRADGHAAWVNARALEAAGIGRETPDPPGGLILRDDTGRPSGVLVDNAVGLVLREVPPPPDEAVEKALSLALDALVGAGFTAVHDAGVAPGTLEAYRRLAHRDALPLRVYAMIDGQGPRDVLEQQLALWARTPEEGRLTVRAVKLFADGALASRGAALHDPYADDPGNVGLLLLEPGELRARIRLAMAAGFQPAVHAIGDRACGLVLAMLADAAGAGPTDLRPRVEHLQTLLEGDIPLLARGAVVASMQPIHAVQDAAWAEARLGRGTPRQRGAYAWRRALDGGAVLAFGSDFPVESFDPRLGLAAAELRLPPDAAAPWMPEQRLTRAEALRAYTVGPAIAASAGDRRGVVREGYDADLTAFDADVLEVPAEDLPRVAITHTVVGGRVERRSGP